MLLDKFIYYLNHPYFMKRKIVEQGLSKTKVVSLPIKWVRKYGLEKGDEVVIEEAGPKLILSTTKTLGFKETVSFKQSFLEHENNRAILPTLEFHLESGAKELIEKGHFYREIKSTPMNSHELMRAYFEMDKNNDQKISKEEANTYSEEMYQKYMQ